MTQVSAAQHNLLATDLQRFETMPQASATQENQPVTPPCRPGYTASGRPVTPCGHTANGRPATTMSNR